MTTRYTVRRYLNGQYASDASTHRTLAAAVRAADKLNRGMSSGWGARIYDVDGERVDA